MILHRNNGMKHDHITDADVFDALFSYTEIDESVKLNTNSLFSQPTCNLETPLPRLRPSYEQQLAINHLLDGDNVVLDSVSGSGKSTTILSCVEQLPDTPILQLTYNSMLRKEVREKVHARNLPNITIHTFHSLAVMYYHKDAHKDIIIRKILYTNMKPSKPIPTFKIIFLDESQDMTLLYFMFMVKFLLDMGDKIQICVLGDYKQGIYQFKGADIRFLTKASQIWATFPLLSSTVFHHCVLSMSYRITNQMADFVNDVMLGSKRLLACKSGPKVHYIRNSHYNIIKIIRSKISALLEAGETPSSIFILSASVKNGYVRKIENYLVERGIPCYVPLFETEQIDERIITGKVVFSTFHSVKGRERKHVFVLGFDQTYFQYYAPELPLDECPNTLYVACTRATENLFVCESDQYVANRPLSFLHKTHFDMTDSPYIKFQGTPQKYFDISDDLRNIDQKDKYHDVTPTSLIRFIAESVIDEITPVLDRAFIVETDAYPEMEIDIPILIHTSRGFYEDVSDLNGIAIPSIYYDHLYKRIYPENTVNNQEEEAVTPTSSVQIGAKILLRMIESFMDDTKENEYCYLKQMVANLPEKISTPEEYLYLSNIFVSVKEKLYYRLSQIGQNDYGWLTIEVIQECIERFDATVGDECVPGNDVRIEYPIIDFTKEEENEKINELLAPFFESEPHKFRFSARTDLITPLNVWELKCTTTITMEHQLQVVIYGWLWKILYPDTPREFRILNIRSGEIQRLDLTMDDLTFIMVALLKGKYKRPSDKTDELFLSECREFIAKQTAL